MGGTGARRSQVAIRTLQDSGVVLCRFFLVCGGGQDSWAGDGDSAAQRRSQRRRECCGVNAVSRCDMLVWRGGVLGCLVVGLRLRREWPRPWYRHSPRRPVEPRVRLATDFCCKPERWLRWPAVSNLHLSTIGSALESRVSRPVIRSDEAAIAHSVVWSSAIPALES